MSSDTNTDSSEEEFDDVYVSQHQEGNQQVNVRLDGPVWEPREPEVALPVTPESQPWEHLVHVQPSPARKYRNSSR